MAEKVVVPEIRNERRKVWKGVAKSFAFVWGLLLVVGLIGFALRLSVGIYSMPSESMSPTIPLNSRIIVNKRAYRKSLPQRGDIIIFISPPAAHLKGSIITKRIVGIPGDVIDFKNQKLTLNGKPLRESYLQNPGDEGEFASPEMKSLPLHVPSQRYYVLGDNRGNSLDSRYFGTIDAASIRGKVVSIQPPR